MLFNYTYTPIDSYLQELYNLIHKIKLNKQCGIFICSGDDNIVDSIIKVKTL